MRSGLGVRQYNTLQPYEKPGSNFTSLVALNFSPEYNVVCYYLIFHVPNFLIALIN